MTTNASDPAPEVEQEAALWVTRLHSGHVTPEERRAFAIWLEENPAHRQAYRSLQDLWDRLEQLRSVPLPELEAARARRPRPSWLPRAAASFSAAAFALGAALVLIVLVDRDGPLRDPMATYRTTKGEQRTLTLADGSAIVLDTDTELRTETSPWSRTVYLYRGQAYFIVSHDPLRAFEVQAGAGQVRDLGTRFEVYRAPHRVSVTVIEGRVRVTTAGHGGKRDLSAGQRLSFDDTGLLSAIERVDTAARTPWLTGKLAFKGTALAEVIAEVGRYHEVVLELRDPRLADLAVSGTFSARDLNGFIAKLEAMLPLKARRIGERTIAFIPSHP